MSKKVTKEELIERAREIHGDKYDYSKMEFKTTKIKVKIICPIHGEFETMILPHIKGAECRQCHFDSKRASKEYIIKKASKVHDNKYDYSKMDYKNTRTKVCIICPVHGEFWQIMDNHLRGHGCAECYNDRHKRTTKSFIIESNIKHRNKYNYSKTDVIHIDKHVCIICPEHGEFWQAPSNHIRGTGCQKCSCSKGELMIQNILTDNNVEFITEQKFDGLKGQGGRSLRFDIYIKSLKTLIEYDGVQHFKTIKNWISEKNLETIQIHDEMKNEFCDRNGLTLIRVPYTMSLVNIKNELIKSGVISH